ncbi:MAG: hypothetical protein ACWA5A_04960 [Marinibacterium sp.]
MSRLHATLLLLASTALAACESDPYRFSTPGGGGAYPINGDVFELVALSNTGAAVYWCGAADYARRALGAPWSDEITISRTLGPSEATDRRSAVQFTLSPGNLGIPPFRSTFPNQLEVGDTYAVSEANLFCNQLRFRNV